MVESYRIRPMECKDLDGVLAVEIRCFSSPWSRSSFEAEIMENSLAHYYVLEREADVVGYAGMWVIFDEAHITNIAIHPDFQSRGLGCLLANELFLRAFGHGARRVTLEVRVSNERAKKMYRQLGFLEAGIRKNYYTDSHEDAIIMWKELQKSSK